jgi:hypothetical protein
MHFCTTPYRGSHSSLIRGTLHTANNDSDVDRAKHVKDTVMKASQFKQPKKSTEEEWIISIMKENKYDLKRMRNAMSGRIDNGGETL